MKPTLSESELEQIFINHRYKKRRPFLVFFRLFFLFLFIFLTVFTLLNFSALKQKITFWYGDQFTTKEYELAKITSEYQNNESPKTDISLKIPDNSIYIESINVRAPIIFNIRNDDQQVSENLKKGVIQLKNSALPGENGTVFITGHSSNFPWVKSDYNAIFALLDKVVIGDLALIKYQNQNYIYRATKIYTVDPNNISVLTNDSIPQGLMLMTCVPVGTNLHRLIIELEQVVPITNGSQNQESTTTKIPNINR